MFGFSCVAFNTFHATDVGNITSKKIHLKLGIFVPLYISNAILMSSSAYQYAGLKPLCKTNYIKMCKMFKNAYD